MEMWIPRELSDDQISFEEYSIRGFKISGIGCLLPSSRRFFILTGEVGEWW